MFGGHVTPEQQKDPAFIQAINDLASRAKQLQMGNRALAYPQAVALAAQQAKQTGELMPATTIPSGHWYEKDTQKPADFQSKGDTQTSPMPLPKSRSDLIVGKWYTHNGQVEQYTGK